MWSTSGACGSGEREPTDDKAVAGAACEATEVHAVQQEHIVALTTLLMQARRVMPPMVRVAREEHVPLAALLMQAW